MRPFDKMMQEATANLKKKKAQTRHIQTNSQYAPKGTFKRMPLLHQDECSFFKTLSESIGTSHALFTKIPFESIIHPSLLNEKAFLAHKTVDYLICDRASTLPVCAIILSAGDVVTEEEFFLNAAGIAVVHLTHDIDAAELQNQIRNASPISTMQFPDEVEEITVTVVNGKEPPKPKRFPTITFNIVEKKVSEKYITYGMYAIWALFGAAILFTIIYVFVKR